MSHKATDRLAPDHRADARHHRRRRPADPARQLRHPRASSIPGAKLVKIPGGSHGFNFETPEIFNRAVLDFLASVRN